MDHSTPLPDFASVLAVLPVVVVMDAVAASAADGASSSDSDAGGKGSSSDSEGLCSSFSFFPHAFPRFLFGRSYAILMGDLSSHE